MKTRPLATSAVASVLALLALGCASRAEESSKPSTPGVTDTTILIGSWAPLTGPAAAYAPLARGMETYFDFVNEEGGIHGRQVRLIMKDDQYQPARTVSAVRELVEQDRVFALFGGVGTASGLAVMPYVVRHGVPWYAAASGAHRFTHPPTEYVFGGLPLYLEQAAVLTKYAVDDLGHHRVGIAFQNDDYGQAGRVGARLALEPRGLELVEAVSAEVMDTDLSAQALRLKSSGADAVLLYLLPRHAAVLVSEAARIGYRPQWLAPNPLADAPLMHSLTRGLWEGTIFATLQEPIESDTPAMQRYRQLRERFAPDVREGLLFYSGIALAEPFVQALRTAGRQLTRARLIEELEGLDGFDGIATPISYGDNDRYGIRLLYLARSGADGQTEALTDLRSADVDVYEAIARMEGGV